ncbi:uncharacterized protein LOC143476923 isoform X2 [Brachyhypopomus gauderio]|uniref:uncharacterized protein LOC143476923 isoform X2 n=1 Tax=Brachyhypopomus gauderio TaxID=698409 RepID=UPI0040416638
MAKGRKRGAGHGPGFGVYSGVPPPPPDGCWGRPPHPGGFRGRPPRPLGPPGPMVPGERFPMGPPDFGPHHPQNEPPEFMMRSRYMHEEHFPPPEFGGGPGFHPAEFGGGPRFPHPDFDARPPSFHPPPYEGGPGPGPGFHPPPYEGGPRPGPGPGFHPPPYEGDPGFYPANFESGPPDFVPPNLRGAPPVFHPPEFEGGPGYPVMDAGCGPAEGYSVMDPNYMTPLEVHGDPGFGGRGLFGPPQEFMGPGLGPGHGPGLGPGLRPPLSQDIAGVAPPTLAPPPPAPCPHPSIQCKADQQAYKQGKSENGKTENPKAPASKAVSVAKIASASVKPPPGRSMGVISFVGNNYGFIECEDLKKFSFSFDAYFGNRDHLLPGVKVHFTAVKELGKECATDVKVAPGGTEEVEATVYEGVVTTVLPDTYVMDPHPGRIRTIVTTDAIKLPFGKADSKTTLLLFDRVKFQLLTDIITKTNRATNIMPQIPETFQLTKEIRETGVIMNIKDGVCTVMSKKHENLAASVSDRLSDDELKIMDEVEFTVLSVKDTVKAIRLKKLPEGSVVFDTQAKNKIAEVKEKATDVPGAKDKWKPVSSVLTTEGTGANEDISSETYEGTVFQILPKSLKKEKEVEEQKLTQGLLDSMVEGTQKRFPFRSGDVTTRATMMVGDRVHFNISTNRETKEERAVNIKIQPDTFQSESEEQRKIGVVVKVDGSSGFIKTPQDPQLFFDLSEVMDDIKLTVAEKVEFTLAPEGGEEVKRAIRIRKLTESVFTSVPKLEALGEKEKKKMTIKLLRDPKEKIMNEGRNGDLMAAVKQEKGKADSSQAAKLPKGSQQETKGRQEKEKSKADRESSRSRESRSRRRSRSGSGSRDRSGSYRRHRSSSRERRSGRSRRSRSRSRERAHRYGRSRSRSRERSGRMAKKRSHSPEQRDEHRKEQRGSKEHSGKRRSPEKQTEVLKKKSASSFTGPSGAENVDDELTKKRKELLELNELIARKRAIIAMEQNMKSFKDVLQMDRQHGFATFDYQHKTCSDNAWVTDAKPVKSILKKHSELLMDPQKQVSKRSVTPEEPVRYPMSGTSDLYETASSVPAWIVRSSSLEIEDQELIRKKKQLEELSESIARKRAIMAMEQKGKTICDEPEIKKESTFASCSENLDISLPNESTWRLDIKPDLQPKKSILKKRPEPLTEQPQSDISSSDQYTYSRDLFPIAKPPQDALLKSLASSHTSLEKCTNLPSMSSKKDDLFRRLINEVSTTSRIGATSTFSKSPGQQLPVSNSGSFYNPKSTKESKAVYSYEEPGSGSTSHSSEPQFSDQAGDQSTVGAGPSTVSSASDQKGNLTTQMQRFLSALNKADPNLLSSLLREAKKDSAPLASPKNPQPHADRNKDELYDPFKETEDADSALMGREAGRIPALERVETCSDDHSQDDLLPHERAVQDGSGFSKIVGMKYGTDTKVENRFLYGEKVVSHSSFSKEQKHILEHRDQSELHQDRYPFEHQNRPAKEYENPHSHIQDMYAGNRERYDIRNESERYKVEAKRSPVHQKSQDAGERGDKKMEHYEKLQSLLQTIGLKLDTAEVSKLADRTRERLYGKKVKPQSSSSHSLEKDEQLMSRYDRKSSRADSTDSEGVRSVSPVRSSNREVYLSYLDSIRHRNQREEEVAVMKDREKDLVGLKRTIKNSPEELCVVQDQYKLTSQLSNDKLDSYKTMEPLSPSAQTLSSLYAQRSIESSSTAHYLKGRQDFWENSYLMDEDRKGNSQTLASPYGAIPSVPLHYAVAQHVPPPHVPPPHVPPGYGSYAPPVNPSTIMPPSPELYPVLSPFPTPPPFGLPPTLTFPPPTSQFDMSVQSGGSAKTKSVVPTRCLKRIETVKIEKIKSFNVKPTMLHAPPALISIQTVEDAQHQDVQGDAESKQSAPITEEDIKAKQKKRLEQFNQRMKLKKEQQMEAQRTRGPSQKTAPGGNGIP